MVDDDEGSRRIQPTFNVEAGALKQARCILDFARYSCNSEALQTTS